MVSPKGLLAADESNKSATKRFESLNIPSSPETRRQYRQLLLTTPNLEKYISGVIFYEETIGQSTDDGTPFTQYLAKKGILTGIKVDKGLVELTNFAPEQITEGLDGLADRLKLFAQSGARFAKWRAAYTISENTPTDASVHAGNLIMSRYAALSQAAGIVPILEPEVIYDGTHSLERCEKTITTVISGMFDLLKAYKVDNKGLILKTSMVLSGKTSGQKDDPETVATATLRTLRASTPEDVAGVVFLSGGQSPVQATANFAAISADVAKSPVPWPITFSFSRAVQEPAMALWLGRAENVHAAQDAFAKRVELNAAARAGTYSPTDDPETEH